jgi:hypothetical protein
MLLTFGPLFVVYQGYNLKNYNAYPAVFFGALTFLFTSIAKFILLATLVPLLLPADDV